MFGLRQKLLMGFAGLFVIMAIIGLRGIVLLSEQSSSIDVILQGDYRSVVACQKMKESLQLVEFWLLERDAARELVRTDVELNAAKFEKALQDEKNNINLPGEDEKVAQLQMLYQKYKTLFSNLYDKPLKERRDLYEAQLKPVYLESIRTIDDILDMNQEHMAIAGEQVKQTAANTVNRMYIMLVLGSVFAIVFVLFIHHWVLKPLKMLTDSVHQIEHGNLDLAVSVKSQDELADLGNAFNAMAAHLRDVRKGDQARLMRTERTTQLAVDSLPDAVLVLSPEGTVDMVNSTAIDVFGLKAGLHVEKQLVNWLVELWRKVLKDPEQAPVQKGFEAAVQIFHKGEERFFLPRAVPIQDETKRLVGITVVLADVTHLRKLDELKSGLLATTSHELKTPLTSLQMAVHLLLEGKLGELSPKQIDLLSAARGDVDRLRGIVENILDYSRIEAGRVRMDMRQVAPLDLVNATVDPMRSAFKTQNVALEIAPEIKDMPAVWADPHRVNLVFANLLSNALKYTPTGGHVKVGAGLENGAIRFSVSDSGGGIPKALQERIFEKFFRVPGQTTEGAGLGLAIAKEVVEAHGGEIGCSSEDSAGSVFSFTLKRADVS